MTDQSHQKTASEIPVWSWVVAAVGLVFVVGSAGFMLYKAIAGGSSAPAIVTQIDSVGLSGDGFLVQISVLNQGGSVAAGLVVEGVLKSESATLETSTITIGYLPSGSRRKAGLYFTKDPQRFDLQVRSKDVEQP